MKIILFISIFLFPEFLFAQYNYDSLSSRLITSRGISFILPRDVDTIKLIEILLGNYGNNNCLNSTWSGYANSADLYTQMATSSSSLLNTRGVTINRISAMYLISALYFEDTLFTKTIMLSTYNKGKEKTISGIDVKLPKNGLNNSTLVLISCKKYGKYDVRLKDKKIINKAINSYWRWLSILKSKGLSYMRANNTFPLSDTQIHWNN